ncbi:hypothetical protein FraQA3DRAFT_3438 [Frankia sp. QA3]|nr:hypothetical protein FraQA3DRAFT_3438 [Frankia sp. QA3]
MVFTRGSIPPRALLSLPFSSGLARAGPGPRNVASTVHRPFSRPKSNGNRRVRRSGIPPCVLPIRNLRRSSPGLMRSPGAHPCGLCVIPIRDITSDVRRWANRWLDGVPTRSRRSRWCYRECVITTLACRRAVLRTEPTSIPRTLTVPRPLSKSAVPGTERTSSTRVVGGQFAFRVVSTDAASPGRLSPSGTGQEVTDDVGDPVVRNVSITLVWLVSLLFWIWPCGDPGAGRAPGARGRSDDRTASAGPMTRTSSSPSSPCPRSRPARRTCR